MAVKTQRIFNHLEGQAFVDLVYDDAESIGTDEFGEPIYEYTKMISVNNTQKTFSFKAKQDNVEKINGNIPN